MVLFGTCLATLFPFVSSYPVDVSGPILYLLHRGEVEKAFSSYLNCAQEKKQHDYALLQQAAKALLEQGIESKDEEIRLLCMFGAGIATARDLMPVLAKGVRSDDPRTQLIALSYLAQQQDDAADEILLDALSSPFLVTRLEALYQLAIKNHPTVLSHLQSLSVKVPDEIKPLFAQIAIHLDTQEAHRYIKNLLFDPRSEVRLETTLTVIEEKRDDFLPYLRTLARGSSYPQLESCAVAFGELQDHLALERLKELVHHSEENIQLAAAVSLYRLGERSYLSLIETLAQKGSLFAISALGRIEASPELLVQLLQASQREVRLNAYLSLLQMRDPRALKGVEEFLIEQGRDLGFWEFQSPGGGLSAWKVIPSASHQEKNYPGLGSQTDSLRAEMLVHCMEFEESDFLKIATHIFEKRQHSLIPPLIELLINMRSEAILSFLKNGYQKMGTPLIRNYCLLALVRLKEKGPYEEQLINWVKEQGNSELIRFKEEDKKKSIYLSDPHTLNPEETSQFLIEACETLASLQTEASIDALIHTIAYGNPKNRYALAGLLIRTVE